jgi:hypothetical protein
MGLLRPTYSRQNYNFVPPYNPKSIHPSKHTYGHRKLRNLRKNWEFKSEVNFEAKSEVLASSTPRVNKSVSLGAGSHPEVRERRWIRPKHWGCCEHCPELVLTPAEHRRCCGRVRER